MNFAFTPEQEEMRRGARRFLGACSSSEHVRAAMQSPTGFDERVWRRIANELGWPALVIPEEHGGVGLSYVELVAILEETGRTLLCAPLFSTVCLATNAILAAASPSQKNQYLGAIAAGELTAALAVSEPAGKWDSSGIHASARPLASGGFALDGTKSFVVDGHTAGLLVIAARRPGSMGDDGVSLFAVAPNTPGLSRHARVTMDATRKLSDIELRDVRIPSSALLGELGQGWKPLSHALDLAAVALAAEQVGGAQRCLDMAVAYANEREQFGRVIGSFQAIKHKCADMLVDVESARSASYYAGWAAAHSASELLVAAPLAKAYCSEAYFRCAGENIQIHGGVGFTWEHDAHLYFKRAKSSESLLGSPSYHRELVALRTGL